MAGPIHLNQAVGFAIEAVGCGVTLLVMMRFGCRVTIAYSMLQGKLDLMHQCRLNVTDMPF